MLASLRFRILLAVAIALLSASLVGAVLARNSAERLAQNLQDQNLRAMAFGFFSSVTASQGSWVTPEELAGFIPSDVDQYFYRLLGPKGSYISGYNFVQVPVEDDAKPGVPYFATWVDGSGETYRGISLRAFLEQPEEPGWVTLQVAQSTRGMERLVGEQMQSYFLTAGLISIGSLLSAVLILSTIFRPLSRLTRSVERRSAEDLSPIQQPVPVEVRPLKNRLNALLEQVQTEQEAKSRLVSNVAHQLRTPLTTIRLRSDLALNADDPSTHLTALDREARRAGTLASQLVHLEAGLEAEDLEPVELVGLLRGLVEDWHAPCRQAGVVLNFAPSVETTTILGNAALIEEVLSNLLDNALAHANATTVTVAVDASGFTVADNGKGVGEAELNQIFERFYSGDSAQGGGHGLGLSIVREFANRMQAEASAWVAEGLHLSLRFKPTTP